MTAARERYEWLVGTRYLRSGNARGFLSFITVISVVGLALGVAVLLVVMSVMNGFEGELRARILSVTSHATLMGLEGPLPDWRRVQQRAAAMPGVTGAAPYIEARAMLSAGTHLAGTQLRGIDPLQEEAIVGIGRSLVQGRLDSLQAGGYGIVLGDALAQELHVAVGGTVVVIAPEGTVTPAGLVPRMRRFTVTGIFHSGMYEYDRGLALLHVADAAKLYRLGDAVTGIRLALADPLQAPALVRQLAVDMGGGYFVSDWTRIHPNFFRSIQMTKSMLFVILSLIVAMAAFNIVATLVMVVKDKSQDIAILRTLGAAPRNVQAVFLVQGVMIGLAGVLAGIILGALLAMNLESLIHGLEALTGTHFLDAKVYFMSDLPAQVRLADVARVSIVALLLCIVATVYPAWRASRLAPAEVLRHD
ncbi:MAG: lipoprotein-releasing ABC transporter permease subunit [Steroidobacteraceae bacterium]